MGKRIEIDGKFYRKREGKLVEIPPEWVGQVPHPQTLRKRKDPRRNKVARNTLKDGSWPKDGYRQDKYAKDKDSND